MTRARKKTREIFVARVRNVRLPYPVEGSEGLMMDLDIYSRHGQRGNVSMPFGENIKIGETFKIILSTESITWEEFLRESPYGIRAFERKISGLV